MKRLLINLSAAFLTLFIGLYAYLFFTDNPKKFWRNFTGAQVSINNVWFPAAAVYRHPDGKLLMNVARSRWYVFIPEERNVARCNPMRHVLIPGYVYVYNWHEGNRMPCFILNNTEKGWKSEITVGPSFIEFNSDDRERIRVSW